MTKQKPAYQVYGTPEHAEWCEKMRAARGAATAKKEREAAAKLAAQKELAATR